MCLHTWYVKYPGYKCQTLYSIIDTIIATIMSTAELSATRCFHKTTRVCLCFLPTVLLLLLPSRTYWSSLSLRAGAVVVIFPVKEEHLQHHFSVCAIASIDLQLPLSDNPQVMRLLLLLSRHGAVLVERVKGLPEWKNLRQIPLLAISHQWCGQPEIVSEW